MSKMPIAACGAALLLAGCASDSPTFRDAMWMGKFWFDHGRFSDAVGRYQAALAEKPEHYDAWIGLANSAAEYSHHLYSQADDMFSARTREAGLRLLGDADAAAAIANKAFAKASALRPSDRMANSGLGLLLYKRATSVINLPYPASAEIPEAYKGTPSEEGWKKGLDQRRAELQEAIKQFAMVLEGDAPGAGTPEHVRRCKGQHAHRYLGLALFLRSDWGQRDGEKARGHLMAYLAYVHEAREDVVKRMPQATPEQKEAKEQRLKRLDTDLLEIRELIRARQGSLTEYEKDLRAGKERPALTPPERDQRVAAVVTELEALRALIREFEKASAVPRPGSSQ